MILIDEKFVLETDLKELRNMLFKEDEEGNRYRERVIEAIEKIGVEKWFELRGLPTHPKSAWKNRYTGDLIFLETEGINFYTWENYNCLEFWDDELMFNKSKKLDYFFEKEAIKSGTS